jgi:glucokinase
MTNHPWDFSIEKTKTALGLSSLVVMNDFEAVARGVPLLSPSDVVAVGGDQKPIAGAPIGIVGPGTGLGIAALVMGADGQYVPVPGEGGHVTAAAQTQREFDVIKILHQKYRHVSVERVCSGKGLVNLYQALRVLDGRNDLPETLEAEEISRRAMESRCPVCAEALDMMMAFLGNVSGNLALTLNAFGGVYLAGGICLQLGEGFMNSRFRAVFEAKGRYEDYLRQVPTYLIRHPYIAFVGLGGVIRANS